MLFIGELTGVDLKQEMVKFNGIANIQQLIPTFSAVPISDPKTNRWLTIRFGLSNFENNVWIGEYENYEFYKLHYDKYNKSLL